VYNFIKIIVLVLLFGCSNLNQKVDINNLAFNIVKGVYFESKGHCSSTFINYKNKIRHITNAHCCTKTTYYNEEMVRFKQIDNKNDLCELQHNSMLKFGISLSNREIKIDDSIIHIGYPFNYILTKSIGNISSFNNTNNKNNQSLTLTNALTLPGMSGGAAVNEYGELVGIISQSDTLGQGRFIELSVLKRFLDK
jgi:V8-like Glu-specific endopeptidase